MSQHPFFTYRKSEKYILAVLIGINSVGIAIALYGLYKLGVILS